MKRVYAMTAAVLAAIGLMNLARGRSDESAGGSCRDDRGPDPCTGEGGGHPSGEVPELPLHAHRLAVV